MPTPHQEWHWGEGNKYVLEGGKNLILINGAAAIGILTFVGKLEEHGASTLPEGLAFGVLAFAFSALFGVVLFAMAYLTQLKYGRDEEKSVVCLHNWTYAPAVLSAILFVAGVFASAWALSPSSLQRCAILLSS